MAYLPMPDELSPEAIFLCCKQKIVEVSDYTDVSVSSCGLMRVPPNVYFYFLKLEGDGFVVSDSLAVFSGSKN